MARRHSGLGNEGPGVSVPMVETLINGRWTMSLPEHRAARPEWTDPGWEVERLNSMFFNLAKDDVLLDVGSEEGDLSGLFASWLPDGGIVLLEPNAKVWPCIKSVWDGNDLKPPLDWWVGFASSDNQFPEECDRAAREEVDGWPACAFGEIIPAHGFRHLAEDAGAIPQVTLDRLAEGVEVHHGRRPTAITMDVEGAELEVLKGATDLLEHDRPQIWVSVHPEFMRHHFGQRPGELFNFMEGYDYRIHHLSTDHEIHVWLEPR